MQARHSAFAAHHSGTSTEKNHRILVVDDNEAIHTDFRKILCSEAVEDAFDAEEAEVFGHRRETRVRTEFELSFATQGAAALELVRAARQANRRFAVVFMDVRMPPGWDGLETTAKLWEVDPDLQVVICTAYSDNSWEEMVDRTPHPERMLILKKPFDPIEVMQLAHALTEKWSLLQSSRRNFEELEHTVSVRTRELKAANTLMESEVASHKATAQALRSSEQELADFFENASVGLLQIGPDGRILRVNRAQAELFGCTRAGCLGRPIAEFHAEPDVAGDLLQRLQAGETVHDFEARVLCKDGTIKHVLLDANALWERGKFLHARCFTRDNTARKIAEAHVGEQAALLDKAQDGIFVHDLDGRVRYWNRGAERLYGWTAEDILGQDVRLVFGRDPEKIVAAKQAALKTGDWMGDLTQCTAGGRELIAESRWTLVRDDQGKAKSILVINTDVTEKRTLEARFLRAQRLESIGTMAGGIAHDLNNILQPIALAMDLFRLELTDPASLSTLELVTANAERAKALIKQVLSFARGVEGERISIDPRVVVKEIASIIRETFPKTIRPVVTIADDLRSMVGDSTQLHQVLLNVCLNARDAMPGGGTLTFTAGNLDVSEDQAATHSDMTAGRYVVFTVADTGTGIPDPLRERIFDPFFTTKEQGKGTGLGLPTALSIVQSHKGFITVNSKPGSGTTFQIFLPAEIRIQGDIVAVPAAESAAAPADFNGHGELILLVDDDAAILRVTSMTLRAFGYRVVLATDGEEGVRAYQEHSGEIKVVITDMVMPNMDGPAMIAVLKRKDPALKVIATTGMSSQFSLDTVARLGVDRILAKPCPAREILLALREVLGGTPPGV